MDSDSYQRCTISLFYSFETKRATFGLYFGLLIGHNARKAIALFVFFELKILNCFYKFCNLSVFRKMDGIDVLFERFPGVFQAGG